jgi:hypothetical protein
VALFTAQSDFHQYGQSVNQDYQQDNQYADGEPFLAMRLFYPDFQPATLFQDSTVKRAPQLPTLIGIVEPRFSDTEAIPESLPRPSM